ncbi:hypothetical protein EJB05_33000 [Eragrostis curvula]|uniref:Uncharacterized protein n=1 Tax=Eragrostis curvula TaxID=38414 RepID=A0A5J9U066_9POAL|nr:hypothetical protein EJB05_33000 [Eragrostis curvula]
MANLVPGFREDDLALRSVAVQMMFADRPLPVRHYNEIGTGEFRPMRRQNASGTGVFFPRAEGCRPRSSKSPGNNGAKPPLAPRLMWKEAPMTMKQQKPKDEKPRLTQEYRHTDVQQVPCELAYGKAV